jgi:hypothetical protein
VAELSLASLSNGSTGSVKKSLVAIMQGSADEDDDHVDPWALEPSAPATSGRCSRCDVGVLSLVVSDAGIAHVRCTNHCWLMPAGTSEKPDDLSQYDLLCQTMINGAEGLLDFPEPESLVGDILDCGAFIGLIGASGAGKSFLSLGLSFCIVTGTPWLGVYPVKRGPVVYVVGEGRGGLNKRLNAWQSHYGVTVKASDGFHIYPRAIGLSEIEWAQALRKFAYDVGAVLVIIDTLARDMAVNGSDENTAKDMGRFIAGCEEVQQSGAAVMVVHHPKKDDVEGGRGSGSFYNAMDIELTVITRGKRIEVKETKQKERETGRQHWVCLKRVEDSAVVVPDDNPPAVKATSATKGKDLATTVLEAFVDETEPRSQSWLEQKIGMPNARRKLAPVIDGLVADGRLRVTTGPKNAKLIELTGVEGES